MQASIQYIPGNIVNNPYPGGSDQYGTYVINISDDNGNPTNGNNIAVSYTKYIDGVAQASETTTVPGLSKVIYSGITSHFPESIGGVEQLETGVIGYILNGNNTPGDPTPPTSPDLQLQSIEIVSKADSNGLNGVIQVHATSSNLPITYTIGATSNTTGLFTNVVAGNNVLTLTDAVAAEIEQNFAMPKLDSILVSTPEVTQGGYASRWSAAFNPVVFTYQRKDMEVTGIAQDTTTLKPKITVNANVSGIAIGDYVYIQAGITAGGEIPYIGSFKVLNKVSTNILIIDTDFVASASVAGYLNSDTLRPYYKINTYIKFVNPDTGRFERILSTNRPNKSGITKADISSLLQSVLKPAPDQSDYTEINYRDMGLAISYQISYAETWEGNDPIYNSITDPFYAVFAAKQLGDNGGGNLIDYVPQPGGCKLVKWLADFIEPNYSKGYPFDLPFIYSEKIAGRQIKVKVTALDINKRPLTDGEYTSFLLNEDGSYLLNQDGSKFIIARQSLVNTQIVEHVGLNRLLIDQDFGPICYYLQVQLYYEDTEPATFSIQLNAVNTISATASLSVTDDDGTTQLLNILANGTQSAEIADNKEYTITGTAFSPTGTNPKLRLTVYKNDVVIYDNQVVAVNGSGIYKQGNATPGAAYRAVISTLDTVTPVTPVNVPDFGTDPEITTSNVTEQILVRYDRKCVNNDIYLRWIGLSGGWNYYKFRFSQDIVLDVQSATIITNYVNDWQNSESIEEVISKAAAKKITVYADELDINDIKGLQGLKYSPKVQILISKSPIKWHTIVLNTSSFTEYNTQVGRSDNFSVTFNMPSINIQNL